MAIEGIDVSHNNGPAGGRWPANIGFVMVKATQGMNFKDSEHKANVENARGQGKIPGSYHFLEKNNGAAQCDEYLSTVRPVAKDPHLYAVDVEMYKDGNGADVHPNPPDLLAFHNRFHNVMPGRALLVYSYASFWHYNFQNYAHNCPRCRLWTSHIHPAPPQAGEWSGGAPGQGYPLVYGGFPGVTLHQYDITSLDLDRYYGARNSLVSLGSSVFNPAPTPVPGDDMAKVQIVCSPGKHHPRILADNGAVSAELGQDTWTAYNELESLGGAVIITMRTEAAYAAIVRAGGGS